MASLLVIVGAIWALLGVANLVGMDWNNMSSGVQSFGLMFNVLLFILPGLVLIGIGEAIRRKKSAPAAPAAPASERLKTLDELLAQGVINKVEHASRRADILKEI